VAKAGQFLPDVILSDLMMPYKDGMQVCQELRQSGPTRGIPVVLLTARPDEGTKIDALLAGATDFIGKPFSLTEVRVRLRNLAESYCFQKELAAQKQQLEAALEQLKESEALLVQHEKLSSLGRMSAGLIHEINNPLNFAVQGLAFLRQSLPEVPDASRSIFAETIDDIQVGVDRVAAIIKDLRGFTRSEDPSFSDFRAEELVRTVLRFFSHHTQDVDVTVETPPDLQIHGSQNQLTQVLVNLVQNALDAMEEKTYPEGEKRALHLSATSVNGRVLLSVRDNGAGMPPETRERIFDPFFTTKEVGKGMGLGLAICHRIIADHQGRVNVTSTPGKGTEFILDLPQADMYRSDRLSADASAQP
jgi:C4-dicarboxylate-specific signal transduction histidine kinase